MRKERITCKSWKVEEIAAQYPSVLHKPRGMSLYTMHAHATVLTHGGHDVEHCGVDGGQEDW